ncbi:hypothetical protein COEREDRAFT_87550 [Coemansia reversa NRRL 1564]|uniref:Uncharacterized protein n=1 Tax=Coemansia reversa (strain ATCC 12441 / NRRL 1564) TaxID=763665 RepID=A0A2G5B9Y2_COERN|nr:hypothetical protein COEREDRAFT_87550 [Coemansia reversa NRRL 1564]|eukprot:PIA15800.1 hypothetical protein COEREDRAFT_87550 [Coemansia reversa NRRL 1564]
MYSGYSSYYGQPSNRGYVVPSGFDNTRGSSGNSGFHGYVSNQSTYYQSSNGNSGNGAYHQYGTPQQSSPAYQYSGSSTQYSAPSQYAPSQQHGSSQYYVSNPQCNSRQQYGNPGRANRDYPPPPSRPGIIDEYAFI